MGRMKEIFSIQPPPVGDVFSYCVEVHSERFMEDLCELLSEQDFKVMKLYIEGLSYEEIAGYLEMNINTVGVRIHRAKKTLAPHFGRSSAC